MGKINYEVKIVDKYISKYILEYFQLIKINSVAMWFDI